MAQAKDAPESSPVVAKISTPTSTTSTRALRGASLLILLQIISRAITFIANQVLLRFLTAQLLGVSTQLEVYYLSVIFFARESLRVAIQRQDSSSSSSLSSPDAKSNNDNNENQQNKSAQAVVNLGYLSILLGIPLSAIFGWMYLNSLSQTTLDSAPNLVLSLYIYAAASILELLSEPAFVVMQNRLQFGTRAAAESVATFLRCTITLGSAVYSSRQGFEAGVLPFALGQLSYGFGLLLVYVWNSSGLATRENFSLLPRRISSLSKEKEATGKKEEFKLGYLHKPTLTLASSLQSQSILKHILTQGDTFLVSILSTPTAQGVYALANNYGGLLARLVFQPIEESSRSYFSRLLSPSSSPDEKKTEESQRRKTAAESLTSLLKLYTLLSTVIISLGPSAAPLLLSLIAGPKWLNSGAGECLAAYMYYIPLLAINGVAEAFVSSVASGKEVHRQSAWMGAFSLIFATAGFVFLRVLDMGAIGLVVANSINMACRIVWCGAFISKWFATRDTKLELLDILLNPAGIAAAAVAGTVVRRLSLDGLNGVKEIFGGLIKVAAVAVPFLVVLAVSERRFLYSGFQALTGRRQAVAA
ncbi:oligosaccharide translocation protein RFT1 [Podospora australis]|uniref:Man(5)GlcNAc(2)-PP-dolichol translocation protein RFT1 n=1 Tax=Podospora australis TaxID=1536484 RepID=A0AAN7AHF7_9PEZI|nr:oligosaccharide translocation protein RFT1 [Podospora australis]